MLQQCASIATQLGTAARVPKSKGQHQEITEVPTLIRQSQTHQPNGTMEIVRSLADRFARGRFAQANLSHPNSAPLRDANLMLLFSLDGTPMPFGFFQAANGISSLFAKTQKIRVKLIPQHYARLLVERSPKFQRQRSVTGPPDIFPKLFLIRREDANSTPPARNADIPLLGIRGGLDR